MFKIFASPPPVNPTPEQVALWQKQYGKKLGVLEADGKTGYVREPIEKEVKKIVQKLTLDGKAFDETKYLNRVMELCWLGGDKDLMNNETIKTINKKTWQ